MKRKPLIRTILLIGLIAPPMRAVADPPPVPLSSHRALRSELQTATNAGMPASEELDLEWGGSVSWTIDGITFNASDEHGGVLYAGQTGSLVYEQWRSQNFDGDAGEMTTPDAVPHGDGIPNLLKFAFNMNASGPDTHSMEVGGDSGLPGGSLVEVDGQTYWRVEFVRRKGSGLAYQPLKSPNLSPDSFVPLSASPLIESIDSEWERVIYDEPCARGEEARCFSRVMVSIP